MLDKNMNTELNRQINHELAAAYNYLAMATWFETQNLQGFAKWMYQQRDEEHMHAQKFIEYVLDRGGKVELAAVAQPASDYDSAITVFQMALQLEQLNTKTIHELYEAAFEAKDYASQSFLKWFLDEQVEEEKSCEDIIALLQMAGDNPSALLMLNNDMGSRTPEKA